MRLVTLKKRMGRKAWGCPRTKSRTNWCYAYCIPRDGLGQCGRVAPHGLLGRTQLAILAHRQKQS